MTDQQITYGILGYPLDHSLSPVLHNTALKAMKVNAVYQRFPLKEEELPEFFTHLQEKNSCILGLNVTVPYKEKVIAYMNRLTPFAEKAMAVNTIVINEKRQLLGYNTDGPGFLTHLATLKISIVDKKVIILGGGGTTRAILTVLSLIPDRPSWIKIYNRTYQNLEKLFNDLSQRMDLSHVATSADIENLPIEEADLIINTTAVGMKEDACLIEGERMSPHTFFYDVIYSPAETKLLKLARTRGARTANGLGMLFYQGVLSLQHWVNIEIKESIKQMMWENLQKAAHSQ